MENLAPPVTTPTLLKRYDVRDPVVYAPTVGEDPWPGIDDVLAHKGPLEFVGLDVETSGLEWDCVLRTVQFGTPTRAVVLDVEADPIHAAAAKEVLARPGLRFTAHNAAFDVLMLHRNGFCGINDIMARMTDTMILGILTEPPSKIGSDRGGDVKHDLKSMANTYLGDSYSPEAKKKLQTTWRRQGWTANAKSPETRGWAQCDVHEKEFSAYAAADVIDGSRLAETLLPLTQHVAGSAVIKREHDLLELCMEMQSRGYVVDRERARKLIEKERHRVADLDEQLAELGVTNPSQNRHVAEILEAETGVTLPATASGLKSVDKLTLKNLTKSKVAPLLLQRRAIEKGASTYLANWLELSESDGRLHPYINSLKATTGRFSMNSPSLQNVPGSLRGYILAHPGTAMITADFSSVEVRIGAGFAGDEQLAQDFIDYDADPEHTFDPYQKVALAAYHPGDPDLSVAALPKQERQRAKSILLGRMYGRGAPGLAKQEGITEDEARAILELIDKRYPKLGRYSLELSHRVKCGQTRFSLPSGRTVAVDPTWARKAMNYCVQGTGRELMVDAGFRLVEAGFRDNLWMSVHDEWLVCVPEEVADEEALRMQTVMNTTFMGVPITASAEILDSRWGKEGRPPGDPKLVFDDEEEERKLAEAMAASHDDEETQ
jgi:DNA polymerase-1